MMESFRSLEFRLVIFKFKLRQEFVSDAKGSHVRKKVQPGHELVRRIDRPKLGCKHCLSSNVIEISASSESARKNLQRQKIKGFSECSLRMTKKLPSYDFGQPTQFLRKRRKELFDSLF